MAKGNLFCPCERSEIGEVPAGGRGCDLTDAFKRAGSIHLIFIIIFNPSVSLRLDISPIFSRENTGAKMEG